MSSSSQQSPATGPRSAAKRQSTRSSALRRQPTSFAGRASLRLATDWRRLLEACPFWIVLFLAVATWALLPRGQFFVARVEIGEIASRNWVADRDLTVVDEAETERARKREEDKVLPVYDFDRGLETARRGQLAELFGTGRQLLAEGAAIAESRSAEELAERLREESSLEISPEVAALFRDWEFAIELQDRLAGVLSRVLGRGVVGDRGRLLEYRSRGINVRELPSGERSTELDLYGYLEYPDQVREVVEEDLGDWGGLPSKTRGLFTGFVVSNVVPNLDPNAEATSAERQEAREAVEPVFKQIRKGEVIVRRGDEVGPLEASAIDQMAGSRDLGRLVSTVLGTALLLAVAMLALWIGIGSDRKTDRSRRRLFNESLILLLLHLVAARFAYFLAGALAGSIERSPFNSLESYVYAVPFASLALHAALLFGRHPAFVLSLVYALLLGRIAPGEADWSIVVYCVAGSFAAIAALDYYSFKQRLATIQVGAWVGLASAFTVLMLEALAGSTVGGFWGLGFDLLCAFIAGLLAAAVASFAVPILENLLSVTTHIKLIELANPNLPLLRRLAFEAPGSFQHSLAVANLAKAGCETVGADAVLIHTCALYHDVGKIVRPHYFIENQLGGQNSHDKIQPSMSALILINHVKEGVELARQHRLPRPVIDAIEQHHGTRLIKFFYNRALDRCDPETDEIREEEFRYPGPKPQSKEMGILMLADAVEAASRTLVEPSQQKLRSMLRAIFDDCLKDRQLEETDLTLGDLRQVEEAFLRVLTNIYHRRIDYPGFDFNRERKKRRGETGEMVDTAAPERRKAS